MLSDREQVSTVTGHKHIDFRFHCAGEDQVIGWIACQRFGLLCWCLLESRRDVGKQCVGLSHSRSVETELARQNAGELDRRWFEQDKIQVPVDGFFDDAAGWSARDECRHQHVGIAGNAESRGHPARN